MTGRNKISVFWAAAILAASALAGGEVAVHSAVPGSVYVNGRYTGRTTPTTLSLGDGTSVVGLGSRHHGYQEQTVVVRGGRLDVHFPNSNWSEARTWRLLMVAVRNAQLRPGITAQLLDSDIRNAYVSLAETNEKWVVPFSYGLAAWDIHALVVEGTRGYVPDDWDQLNAGRLLKEAALEKLPEEFDFLFFLWPSIPRGGYKNLPEIFQIDRGVGGGADMTIPNNCFRSYSGPSEMLLHEWLHIVEGHYGDRGFSMGEEGLHGGQKHGYRAGVEGDWLHWYRPFMRAQVREKANFVGVPPTAWKTSSRLPNKPQTTTIDNHKGVYRLINAHSGKALDVSGASTEADAPLIQHDYTGSPSQHWRLEPSGDYFLLVNERSGHAIDVPNASREEGVQLIQWHKDPDRENQQWTLDRDGPYRRIRCRWSGHVLDVDYASVTNNARILQWGSHGGKNQSWLLLPVIK